MTSQVSNSVEVSGSWSLSQDNRAMLTRILDDQVDVASTEVRTKLKESCSSIPSSIRDPIINIAVAESAQSTKTLVPKSIESTEKCVNTLAEVTQKAVEKSCALLKC
ncbi:MAG: hypothetical protein LLG04_04180 [Parachlamydia sp.]|nr:hypothetical protein [Parachlamydia sp.]